ncbi:hypothetical protein ACLB2K_048436 [Fragaria x ananassa]
MSLSCNKQILSNLFYNGQLYPLLLCQYLLVTSDHCSGEELPGGVKCIDEERRVLLTFRHHLTDPSAGFLLGQAGDNCCQWNGLSCDNQTSHIVKMDLRNPYPYRIYNDEWDFKDYQQSCLSGKINPSLLSLKHLYYLDLSWNDFHGIHIPNFLGKLTSLRYLNLSYASFREEIPHFLGNLSNLNYLDLDNSRPSNSPSNNPDENLSSKNLNWFSRLFSLKYLNLGRANLGGAGLPLSFNSSIPSWISNLTSLSTLDLHDNAFSGQIPKEFASFKNLEHLDLSVNELEGQIPKLTGKFCTLKTFNLADNRFEEGLRDVLNGLTDCSNTRLESLDFSLNWLESELPASIGKLHKLQYLNLEGNSFFGSIPESIGNLKSMRKLILSRNLMNGSIPEVLGQLVLLDLSGNLWEGSLTESHFGNLTKLDSFLVSTDRPLPLIFNVTYDSLPPFKLHEIYIANCLVGDAFAVWLQSQTELSDVTLSGTVISGIPEEWLLKISSQVEFLDFSHNQIQGQIRFESQSIFQVYSIKFWRTNAKSTNVVAV